jgi:hypothetical protein
LATDPFANMSAGSARPLLAGLAAGRQDVAVVDWDNFDFEQFASELRGNLNGQDAEKLIWAFEQAVRVARIDDDLLSYMTVAIVCLLARMDESSPRAVLDAFFRRSVSDEDWRRTYLPLFA